MFDALCEILNSYNDNDLVDSFQVFHSETSIKIDRLVGAGSIVSVVLEQFKGNFIDRLFFDKSAMLYIYCNDTEVMQSALLGNDLNMVVSKLREFCDNHSKASLSVNNAIYQRVIISKL